MFYLIFKIFFLLALASLLGFWLGMWFSRRTMVDVTEEHEKITTSLLNSANNARANEGDFVKLNNRLGSVEPVSYTHLTLPTKRIV